MTPESRPDPRQIDAEIEAARHAIERGNMVTLSPDVAAVVLARSSHSDVSADLVTAVELADTRTGVVEEKDGMVEVYSLRASDWHRVVAVARGHVSEKARQSLDRFREEIARLAAPSAGAGTVNGHCFCDCESCRDCLRVLP